MPNLDVLDPTLSTTVLTLGIALIVAAIVGGGFEAAGTKIPVITGWRRQAGAALFGLALIGFGWSALQAAHWRADYVALVKGIAAKPPLPPAEVADNLNALAVKAAANYNRNCEIAYFIYDHKVDIPVAVRLQLVRAQHGASPALQCYLDIAQLSAKAATVAQDTTATPEPPIRRMRRGGKGAQLPPETPSPAPTVPVLVDTPAERILAAITPVGAKGWIYLGHTDRPGELGAGRTVREATPRLNGPLTTSTAVHLRDPAAQSKLSSARIVGVIPKGSTVLVTELSGINGPDVWARVDITQEPHAP